MLISLLIILTLFNPVSTTYLADRAFFDVTGDVVAMAPERINPENVGVKVSAEKYVAIDVNSGKILLQKNVEVSQPIASITKLMTALVILDLNPNWDQVVEMQKVDETYGAFAHIYRGEEVLFEHLWQAALVTSDNNSIMAMIRALGLTRSEFVEKMNVKAKELEMYSSIFADPSGLSELNQATALDVSRLLYNAMKEEKIQESVLSGKYSFKILNNNKKRTVYNTDILIDSFLNKEKYGYELIGGKTGYLPEAGYCLSVKISHEGNPVAIIVLNSETIETRFQDVKVIADWVFNNYEWNNDGSNL